MSNMKHDGQFVDFHPNSNKKRCEGFTRNGKLHGKFTSWHLNGNLDMECTYSDGVEDGCFKSWGSDGKLLSSYEIKNDVNHGKYEIWYSSGVKKEERNYIDGKKHGQCRKWDESANLIYNKIFNNGVCEQN